MWRGLEERCGGTAVSERADPPARRAGTARVCQITGGATTLRDYQVKKKKKLLRQ